MRCPRCKSVVADQDRFCRQCGGRVGPPERISLKARGTADTTLSTSKHPSGSSRATKAVGAVLIYLAMGVGSGVAAHELLAWRAGAQGGSVTLGTPRLVVLTPASQATVPDAVSVPSVAMA